MNQIFESNLELLSKKNKALADAIVSPDIQPVQMEKTKTGEYTFKYKGKYFHSPYDPLKEADRYLEEIAPKKFDWLILLGMGCGYIPKLLMEKGKEKIIVYEPSLEIVKGVLSEIDMKELFSNSHFILCHTPHILGEVVRNYTEGMDDLLGYYTPPYRQTFPEELKEFMNKVNSVHTSNKVIIKTEIESRLMWVENYFANIKHIARYRAVDALKHKFKDIPLVIVGAGPSLEKNAHLLKDIKGKAVIIAAITAYKALLKFGVIPDFVIAGEKVDLPNYFTYGPEDKEIRLILGSISHPNMFTKDVKGKFAYFSAFFNLSGAHLKFWNSDYLASSGGSVTTSALDMGVMFGCNPIIFIGQDLAYTDGKGYVPGSPYKEVAITIDKEKGVVTGDVNCPGAEVEKLTYQYNILWLKGYYGGMVASKYDWATFHQWLENYMTWFKKEHPNRTIINATEGGAYIDGMEHIRLIEAIEKYNINKEAHIEDIISGVEREKAGIDFEGLENSFSGMRDALKSIRLLAKAIVKEAGIIERIVKSKGMTPEFVKNTKRIKKLENRLFDKSDAAVFMWEALCEYTYQLKEYLKEDLDEKMDKQFKRDLDVVERSYKSVIEACDRFLPKLEKVIEDVKECSIARG